MSLHRLPYEVISIITQSLVLEDIFNLALSCQHFKYLIYDDRHCRVFLKTLAPATPEAQEAAKHSTSNNNAYARALRRLVKRRQAIRTATPFTAAIVAVAESWLYTGGVLCYLQDHTLRVLDLHASADVETVVEVPDLLGEGHVSMGGGGDGVRRRRYKLQLLHYAEGLLTCLYSRSRESRLVVFSVVAQELVAMSPVLESTDRIFVRNDADFLYFGTHSEYGPDGFRRWVLMRYDIGNDWWLEQKIHLMDLVGSDIGQSICFEIIDGKFYGLSNQTSFEVDEDDWTSYYHCFRFPVGDPGPKVTERSDRQRMWRRQHADGPIDDRWSFLKITKNEQTGDLQILESRKEWLNRSSSGQRTYYTTDLHFAKPQLGDDNVGEAFTSGATTPDFTYETTSTTASASVTDSGGSSSQSTTVQAPRLVRTNFTLPTTATTPRHRDPHKTHTGDDASTALLFTFSKCPVRSYHAPSQTFLDLVNDPTTSRLRLRAGSRQLAPAASVSLADDAGLPHVDRARRLYKRGGANEIAFWPPAPYEVFEGLGADGNTAESLQLQQQQQQQQQQLLERLERVVNPPLHAGNVVGAWDERSFVYSVESTTNAGMRAVVFVGFDPAIKLRDLPEWGEQQQQQQQHDLTTDITKEDVGGDTVALLNGEGEQDMQAASHYQDEQSVFFEPDCNKGKEIVATMPDDDLFGATWGVMTPENAGSPRSTADEDSSCDDEPLDCAATALSSTTWSSFSSLENNNHTSLCQQQQQQQQQKQKQTHGLNGASKCGTLQSAMYLQLGCGFNNLPDFTQNAKRAAAARLARA
ncbi:unnamed protein product [Discula destructiva]